MVAPPPNSRPGSKALPLGNFPLVAPATEGPRPMHDHDPFRAPRREPKLGTFHRPAHGVGEKVAPEAVRLKLSGPTATGEEKLGEGSMHLPLGGPRAKGPLA